MKPTAIAKPQRTFNPSWLLRVRPAFVADILKRVLGIRREVAETNLGLRFWVDPASHFGHEVISTGSYEPPLTALLHALLRPGDVFVDVGANEGYFSIVGSRSVPGGHVFAFEPQSRLAPIVRENIRLNECSNVDFFPAALSDSRGTMTIHLAPSVNTGASGMVQSQPLGRQETVQMTTFDAFAAEHTLTDARLIKIDCEGAEAAILKGAEQFLGAQGAQFVSVDYHESIVGAGGIRQIDAAFRRWGYLLTEAGNGCWLYHRPGLNQDLASLGPFRAVAPL